MTRVLMTLTQNGIDGYTVLDGAPAPIEDHRIWLVSYGNEKEIRHELYAHVGELYCGSSMARGYSYFEIKDAALAIHTFMGNRTPMTFLRLFWVLIRMVRL
jgi:hypothetical protein